MFELFERQVLRVEPCTEVAQGAGGAASPRRRGALKRMDAMAMLRRTSKELNWLKLMCWKFILNLCWCVIQKLIEIQKLFV